MHMHSRAQVPVSRKPQRRVAPRRVRAATVVVRRGSEVEIPHVGRVTVATLGSGQMTGLFTAHDGWIYRLSDIRRVMRQGKPRA